MSKKERRGPAVTVSLYSLYLRRFFNSDTGGYDPNLMQTLIPEENFYSAMFTHDQRVEMANTSDPTFRGKNGTSHCVKKSTGILRS